VVARITEAHMAFEVNHPLAGKNLVFDLEFGATVETE
jgi:FKBP-type peptidyl-prolyl cis-trans isomerase 2